MRVRALYFWKILLATCSGPQVHLDNACVSSSRMLARGSRHLPDLSPGGHVVDEMTIEGNQNTPEGPQPGGEPTRSADEQRIAAMVSQQHVTV
jgi:hypothetical protein